MKISEIFYTRAWRTFMGRLYGWGAAVVIIAILFKLLHMPLADYFLIVGLTTEAIIFFFYAFEPSPEEYDWTLVYPELAGKERGSKTPAAPSLATGDVLSRLERVMQGMDRMDPEAFAALNASIGQLNRTAQNIAETSAIAGASKQYVHNLQDAALAAASLTGSFQESARMLNTLKDTVEEAQKYQEQIALLNKNLVALNEMYANMLSAMKVK